MSAMRRIFSLLLVLAMVFALVACAGGESPAETDRPTTSVSNTGSASTPATSDADGDVSSVTDSAVSSESDAVSSNPVSSNPQSDKSDPDVIIDYAPSDFVPPEINLDDFAGKIYTIIQHQEIESPFGYSQDSRNAHLVADRLAEVQDKYGCEIVFTQIAYAEDFATQLQGLSFAKNGGDMVFSHNNAQLRRAIGTGPEDSVLVDLLAVDHIINFWDFNKWGNITSRETLMSGGTFYGVTPALWYNYTPLPYYNLVYSKSLIEKFQLSDPQELWEQNAWDRDAMLDLVTSCYDDTSALPVWGMTASMMHMVRASYLSSGASAVELIKIYSNGTVDWQHGMLSSEAKESLQWLKNSLSANKKYFNNGKENWTNWSSHQPFLDGQSLMCLTAPSVVLDQIAVLYDGFGLIPWGGAEANVMSGYYENCCSVAIPTFAQDAKQSAYLMFDLFEGLGDIETQSDVVEYYRTTYFDSDLDVAFLLMLDAKLKYSYWPNGGDEALKSISSNLMGASSVETLVDRYVSLDTDAIETYILPNMVQLEIYRQNGYIR